MNVEGLPTVTNVDIKTDFGSEFLASSPSCLGM